MEIERVYSLHIPVKKLNLLGFGADVDALLVYKL
jgi:hypothetical protein